MGLTCHAAVWNYRLAAYGEIRLQTNPGVDSHTLASLRCEVSVRNTRDREQFSSNSVKLTSTSERAPRSSNFKQCSRSRRKQKVIGVRCRNCCLNTLTERPSNYTSRSLTSRTSNRVV